MGSSKEDEKFSADDTVRLLTHFSVSRSMMGYMADSLL
jgi:hypothetical protein